MQGPQPGHVYNNGRSYPHTYEHHIMMDHGWPGQQTGQRPCSLLCGWRLSCSCLLRRCSVASAEHEGPLLVDAVCDPQAQQVMHHTGWALDTMPCRCLSCSNVHAQAAVGCKRVQQSSAMCPVRAAQQLACLLACFSGAHVSCVLWLSGSCPAVHNGRMDGALHGLQRGGPQSMDLMYSPVDDLDDDVGIVDAEVLELLLSRPSL